MWGGRELILEYHPSPGRIPRDEGELDVEELWDVERTMVISYGPLSVRTQSQMVAAGEPAGGYWSWQENPSGVYCLEDSLKVALPGNLSNQDGGKSFMTQLFNHAEEVDLASMDLPVTELIFEVEGSNCDHVLLSHT